MAASYAIFPCVMCVRWGADIVIGSNVTNGLLPSDQVRNVLQILMQVVFFREAEDAREEVPQCDIYIPFKMDKYNMGSFPKPRPFYNSVLKKDASCTPPLKTG